MFKPTTPNTPRKAAGKAGFLGRLRKDERGNALAIMTAAIFPLAGMVGGAVDMSRLYLVKSRLQQACDAGVLAGRRVMVGSSVVADANAMQQAQSFYRINLANGAYGATVNDLVVTDVREGGVATGNVTGRVAGSATATVPMTLMRIFGNDAVDMTATCEANLNISNNDIMFVLDLTGSMGCRPAGDNACFVAPTQVNGVWRVPESNGSKIAALRAAVGQFFTTLNSATPPTARLRIGFAPYSSSINAAAALPAGALAQTHLYRSRAALFDTPVLPSAAGQWWPQSSDRWQVHASSLQENDCARYMNNQSPYNTPLIMGGPSPQAEVRFEMRGDGNVTSGGTGGEWGWTGAPDTGGESRSCRRRIRTTSTNATRFAFTRFVYGPQTYNAGSAAISVADMAVVNRRNAIRTITPGTWNEQEVAAKQAAATAFGATVIQKTWAGDCIEERQDNANIDLLATNEDTRWKPARQDLVYYPSNNDDVALQPLQSQNNYTCTMPSQRLQVMTQAQVDAYVADPRFAPIGATYHDIGMIWGTRMMSLSSVFAADHSTAAPNGREVRRHIIFMTDGDMQPSLTAYATYGVEQYDRRISTAGTDATGLRTLHNQRFAAACNYAKNPGNISVWVVAFGQTLTTDLTNCADAGQARQANNAAELQTMLQEIATKIAELRLSE